jgi:hypothetical protein
MKKFLLSLAIAAASGACLAQGALDGTWKLDPQSVQAPTRQSQYMVKDGMYQCLSCVPTYKVKADGTDQRVAHAPYIDTLAVTIVDDHTVHTFGKLAGKDSEKITVSVSADGGSMTRENTFYETNGTVSTSKITLKRTGKAPAGSHAMSGTWRPEKVESVSDTKVTFKTVNGVLSMNSSDGSSYEARLDGTRAAVKGDPGTDMVSVKMKGPRTIEEVSYHAGKTTFVTVTTVDASGTKAKVTWTDKASKNSGGYVLLKE